MVQIPLMVLFLIQDLCDWRSQNPLASHSSLFTNVYYRVILFTIVYFYPYLSISSSPVRLPAEMPVRILE